MHLKENNEEEHTVILYIDGVGLGYKSDTRESPA